MIGTHQHVRGSVEEAAVKKMKIPENRLKWYEHVKRRDDGHVLRGNGRCTTVPRKRGRGGQKTRWKDSCKIYMESVV